MHRRTILLAVLLPLSLWLAGCAWKPDVAEVPLTEPWLGLNLPVQENAVVWASDELRLKVVHKAGKKSVLEAYLKSLEAQGWSQARFDSDTAERYKVEMTKGGESLKLEFYDFDNTGVILERVVPPAADEASPAGQDPTTGKVTR
jgi:hypothetical protein